MTKAYAADDQNSEEEGDEDGDEVAFLIGSELNFERRNLSQDQAEVEDGHAEAMVWDSPDGDLTARYMFVVSKGNADAFELHLARALYERQFQRSADEATPQQLEAFRSSGSVHFHFYRGIHKLTGHVWPIHKSHIPEAPPAQPCPAQPRSTKTSSSTYATASNPENSDDDDDDEDDQAIQDALVSKLAGVNINSTSRDTSQSAAPPQPEEEKLDLTQIGHIAPLPSGSEAILQEQSDLYLHDIHTSTFIKQSEAATVTLWRTHGAEWSTWFTIVGPFGEDSDVMWISAPLTPDISIYFREVS